MYDYDSNDEKTPCIAPEDMELSALYGADEHEISLDEARELGVEVDSMSVEFGNYDEWED